MEQNNGTIGQSVVITGELRAKEDLTIEGRVDGNVELEQHVLTIRADGKLKAQVVAKTVIVMGRVKGDITATEAIRLRETATVEGDLVAPKVGIGEGASFRGRIDMGSSQTRSVATDGKRTKTQAPPQAAVA